jgi:Divergent InlB B-repeat domain
MEALEVGLLRVGARLSAIVLAVVLLVCGPAATARAATPATMTVDNCSSDAQLQADVATANTDNDGDTIEFSCGGTIALSKTIAITGNMTIDATGQPVTLNGTNTYQVISITGSTTAVTLRGLTIENGAEGTSSTTMQQLTQSPYTAGGVYSEGTLTVDHCTFTDNSTTAGATPPNGGALTALGPTTVTDSTFTGNHGFNGGAAWLNAYGDTTTSISGSTFTGNETTTDNGTETGGGAMQLWGAGTISITDSSITGNTGQGAGGGIAADGPGVEITGSTIANNTALNENGGGILAYGLDETLTVTNSTISGNDGNGGGGIWAHMYTVSIQSTTFTGNDPEAHPGAAIYDDDSTIHVSDSILDDTTGTNCSQALDDSGYNIDNGTSCGLTGTGSQQNTDPKLDPSGPQNHGGPTATIALQSGSPAIDKIPKADCPATDQRGYPRPAAGQSMCDMGSYEAGSAPPAKLTVTSAGAGTGTVTSSPAGIDCGSACSFTFQAGQQITLTATPAGGSTFTGWSGGGCSGTGTCVVPLSDDTGVTATFGVPPSSFRLTVSVAGKGSGTVTSSPAGVSCPGTCSATDSPGTKVTLTAKAAAGSKFTGWSGACSGTGSCSVTLGADQAVTATFSPNSGGAPGPKPSCKLSAKSATVQLVRAKKGRAKPRTLEFVVRCDQAVSLRLSATLTETVKRRHHRSRSTHVSLRAVRRAAKPGRAAVLTLKLSAGATKALAKGVRESVTATLTASDGNGTCRATAKIARLRGRR